MNFSLRLRVGSSERESLGVGLLAVVDDLGLAGALLCGMRSDALRAGLDVGSALIAGLVVLGGGVVDQGLLRVWHGV